MDKILTCSFCGRTVTINRYVSTSALNKRMRIENLCYDCAFWKDYLEHPRPGSVILSGKLYALSPITRYLNGTSRRRNGIQFARNMQTGKAIAFTSYHCLATVPRQFRERIPDQYRFISERTYTLLWQRTKKCCIKGCWDRYHCWWYDKDKAEPKGPWNEIPKTHKIGDENCESFINKETMYIETIK